MRSHLQFLALNFFQFCVDNHIDLSIVWIPRELNHEADSISRDFDFDDRMVKDYFFDFVQTQFGIFPVDCFADCNNCKVPEQNLVAWLLRCRCFFL